MRLQLQRLLLASLLAGSLLACGGRAPAPVVDTSAAVAGSAPAPRTPEKLPSRFDPTTSDAAAWMEAAAGEARGASTARAAVEGLYRTHAARRASGIPRGEDIPDYRRWLSARLVRGFAEGALERDKAIAEEPDAKPPYIEGDMFSSLFEGATAFELLPQAQESAGRTTFAVRFSYKDRSGQSNWTDRVVAIREDGRWVVDDVLYGGDWDFAAHGRLSDALPAGKNR